jgi:hypothetical protein
VWLLISVSAQHSRGLNLFIYFQFGGEKTFASFDLLIQTRLIASPAQMKGGHWVLNVILPQSKAILTLDSSPTTEGSSEWRKELFRLMTSERIAIGDSASDIGKWRLQEVDGLPSQGRKEL